MVKKIYVNEALVDNFYTSWKQINPKFPDTKIEVYGPSFNSGTRDAFIELIMHEFCNKESCKEIREDGHYIEMPENDNLIIHKLINNKKALGIISFSLLNENSKIKAASIDNIVPTKETIINEEYSLARPLLIYVNDDHIKLLPQLNNFINLITSSNSLGPNGYLTRKGLLTRVLYDR